MRFREMSSCRIVLKFLQGVHVAPDQCTIVYAVEMIVCRRLY